MVTSEVVALRVLGCRCTSVHMSKDSRGGKVADAEDEGLDAITGARDGHDIHDGLDLLDDDLDTDLPV